MANPEHEAELDGLDRLTVVLYRLGLLACAVGQVLVAFDSSRTVSLRSKVPLESHLLHGLKAARRESS